MYASKKFLCFQIQNLQFEIHYSQFEFKFGFHDNKLNGQNGTWINLLVKEINQIFEQTGATSSTITLTLTMTTKKKNKEMFRLQSNWFNVLKLDKIEIFYFH